MLRAPSRSALPAVLTKATAVTALVAATLVGAAPAAAADATGGPGALTAATTATFLPGGSDLGSFSLQCSLDGAPYVACTAPASRDSWCAPAGRGPACVSW